MLFGTDGIRGIAGKEPVTTETAMKLGSAAVRFCRRRGASPRILIGRDTRASGPALERAIASGIISAGGTASSAGVIPTPAVAHIGKVLGTGLSIVVSASHNPYAYNGFKLFTRDGVKLSDREEEEIESLIGSAGTDPVTDPKGADIIADALDRYVDFLIQGIPASPPTLDNYRLVLDCANGAAYQAAPLVFERLGIPFEALADAPNGENINRECGSQHTDLLERRILETGADAGFAFDGDGDRLAAVDETGNPLTGDQVLVICASALKRIDLLSSSVVVHTVMSNLGLKSALRSLGLEPVATQVGDRFVAREMRKRGATLGGEESGHILFHPYHTTGDGIFSALHVLFAMRILERPLSELARLMPVFPQCLVNVAVRQKPEIEQVPALREGIRGVEELLGDEGRVLVRYSGTEPVCRIMVEAAHKADAQRYADEIASIARVELGSEPEGK